MTDTAPALLDGPAITVRVSAAELRPETENVSRHAGGEKFVLTLAMRATVERLLPAVAAHISPRYSFATFAVARAHDDCIELATGAELPFGFDATGAPPAGLAAALCTMGAGTDGLAAKLTGSLLAAWLLDAVLLAQLELLESRCLHDLSLRAAPAGLCIGPPLVPAVAGVPLRAQDALFACLGPAAAGVRLNAAGAMTPLKSFTCWFPLFRGPAGAPHGLQLCTRCDREACTFRRTTDGGHGGETPDTETCRTP